MNSRFTFAVFLFGASLLSAQNSPPATPAASNPQTPPPFGTRPSEHNDTTLRALSPEEIPPNLNFYAINPLYKAGASLGWANERIEEKLDRGVVALLTEGGKVYVSWRLLRTDPQDIAFNIYRASSATATAVKLNAQPISKTTDFVDTNAPAGHAATWSVRAVLGGREQEPSPTASASLPDSAPVQNYRAIKLKSDVRGVSIVGLGDLDGDGTYDFVVKHPAGGKDPGSIRPNTTTYKIDGYNGKTGEFMWRIDLGWNIDMGIWWTPMVVRDLDGDNKAEICLRTAPYAATPEEAFGGNKGFVLEGPEWLGVYSGETGKLIDQVDWIERGKIQDWADNTGNRASRHMLGVAYLDGKTPSVLVVRGTYGLMKVDAWTLKNKKLEKLWRWTNERAPFKYHGQGQHSIKVADIDGDGCDEILNGSIAIDNDGRTMWSTGLGHGDRFYITDVDPDHPGLEVWYTIEDPHPQNGVSLWDAKTGDRLFGTRKPNNDNQIGGGAVGDIDPAYPGMEVWGDRGEEIFFSSKGELIPGPVPTGDLVWWDADPLREIIRGTGFGGGGGGRGQRPGEAGGNATNNTPASDNTTPAAAAGTVAAQPAGENAPGGAGAAGQLPGGGGRGFGGARTISKWKGATIATGIQGSGQHIADIMGDWREEVVTVVNGTPAAEGRDATPAELRIYSTTIPASDRRVCLMQDPLYRNDVTLRSMGYPHVPQLSYYLGTR
jgi:rhamnogalacturonan endolyase